MIEEQTAIIGHPYVVVVVVVVGEGGGAETLKLRFLKKSFCFVLFKASKCLGWCRHRCATAQRLHFGTLLLPCAESLGDVGDAARPFVEENSASSLLQQLRSAAPYRAPPIPIAHQMSGWGLDPHRKISAQPSSPHPLQIPSNPLPHPPKVYDFRSDIIPP